MDPSDNAYIDNNMGQSSDKLGGTTRRQFITRTALAGMGLYFSPGFSGPKVENPEKEPIKPASNTTVNFVVNKKGYHLAIDPRVTLLDALREKLALTGTKKGCDHGQCGACTVLVNGRRVNSCLLLAAMCEQADITTVEGLAEGDNLHPMQEAFIKHDAFQCGYCTPGQICSAIGLIKEGHARDTEAIQELMSGNICRCGAYQNITEAIKEVMNI